MEFETFYNEVSPYIEDRFLNSELKNILVTFTSSRNWTLIDNNKAEAPALIKPQSNYIAFNPILIAASLFELRKELGIVNNKDEFYKQSYSKIKIVCKCIKTFLLLHEIGHWLYTANPKDVLPLVQKYCSNFPIELTMYLINVVEDSVIQRLFMLEYRGSFYRQCFDIGICCFQGAEAVKTYVAKSEEANWSIKTKLFYFIIRAYNLHNSEVQAMFNIPDKIGWKNDTIQAFDQAITTIDKNDRAKYVCEVLAPLVFRDLVEEIDASEGTPAGEEDSLLDQDKLYKANNPLPGNSSGKGSSSGTPSGQQSNSSQEDEEESEDSETDSNEGTDGNSSQEDAEENGQEGDGTSEGEADGDGDGNSNGEGSSDEESDKEEKEESSKSNQSSNDEGKSSSNPDGSKTDPNAGGSGNKSNEELPEVTAEAPVEKSINEQIAEACKELNKSINASSEPSEMSEAPRLKEQTNPLAVSCNVIDHTHIGRSKSDKTATMNSLTLEIYGNAIGVLDKIFTMSNSVLRGLDQGELDEDELYTYYTEKNLNIYKEENKVKQDKKVIVYFILDNSGSMSGHRYAYSSAAFIGLIHALEDIQIKCCFLSFGEDVRLIKRFDDPTSFLGAESPLQYMVNEYVSDLESDTNLFPALDYVINDDAFLDTDPDLCKVVIVATDGCTNKESACAYVAEQISSQALMFAVGLDMSGSEDYLQRVMPGAIVRNYDGSTIATKLPEDIYEEIINRFLLY